MSIPEKRLHEGFARLRGILIWIFVSGVVYSFAAAWILSRITLESGRTMVRKASDLMRQELAGSHLASEKEKEELTLALSGLMGGVVTLDSRDRLVFWNEAVGRFLEWSATPNKGAHISDVVRVSALFEMVDQVRENGIGIAREISIWRKGTERVMNVHILPCKLIEGSGIMIVLNDNTSLRFLERTRQEFVANASHELKTPLTAIKGYVDSLKDGGDADPGIRKKFLDQLSHNVDRLVALADDLLSLSRIEEADETLRLDRVNLLNLVNRVVERHRPLSENKGVGISTAVQPSADWEISSHSESLQQVLDNLIENAIKYTNPGGRVSVGLKRNENEVQILVSDTGIGIPKSDFERIFERFYRVDKSRSLEVGGTGLGLSIVKHLLVKLNGSVNVESELGRGSQFTMHLPIIS